MFEPDKYDKIDTKD